MKGKKAKSHSKKPIKTAKKHWIVYVLPALFIAFGIGLISQEQAAYKAIGGLAIVFALIRIIQVSSIKIHLMEDHIYVEAGWPWDKKHHYLDLTELYKSSVSKGALSRFLNVGTITTHKRESDSHSFKHGNISNAEEFARHISQAIKSHPQNDLNTVYELKEKGAISQQEYEAMKLGFITQRYLGKL